MLIVGSPLNISGFKVYDILATCDRRQSLEGPQRSIDRHSQNQPSVQGPTMAQPSDHLDAHDLEKKIHLDHDPDSPHGGTSESLLVPIPITISPATPDAELVEVLVVGGANEVEKEKDEEKEREKEQEKKNSNGVQSKLKRSTSLERNARGGDKTKTKRVQRILKDQVHKGRAGITAVSRRIGHGVAKNGPLRRTNSTPSAFCLIDIFSYQFFSRFFDRLSCCVAADLISGFIHSFKTAPQLDYTFT